MHAQDNLDFGFQLVDCILDGAHLEHLGVDLVEGVSCSGQLLPLWLQRPDFPKRRHTLGILHLPVRVLNGLLELLMICPSPMRFAGEVALELVVNPKQRIVSDSELLGRGEDRIRKLDLRIMLTSREKHWFRQNMIGHI